MTLAEIRAAHPSLFYGGEVEDPQSGLRLPVPMWFDGHAFMATEASGQINPLFTTSEVAPDFQVRPIRAVDLAALYVADPHASVWKKFLWTDDVDSWGNRIYVAGVGQYGCAGFQIHRHLQPACYWVRST